MTDTTKLPFSLDYGSGFEQIYTPASDMTNSEFVKTLTDVKFDYDYSDPTVDYSNKSFFEELADNTSNIVNDTSGYVWDTAKGAYVSVKSGVSSLGTVITDAGKEIQDSIFGGIDSLLIRGLIIFAVFLAGIYLIAKSGFLKQAAAFR
jgi:hypothetical protein